MSGVLNLQSGQEVRAIHDVLTTAKLAILEHVIAAGESTRRTESPQAAQAICTCSRREGGRTATYSSTRRQRLHAEMAAQIRSVARIILRTGGVNAISLRATARVIGVTPAAIYRYYPSLRALVDSLRGDILEELDDQLGLVCSQIRGGCATDRLYGVARAFRRWALDHPAEFWLALSPAANACGPSNPVAGAGAELITVGTTPDIRIPESIITLLESSAEKELVPGPVEYHADFRAPAGFAVASAWARLYGLVATEVAGYMRWSPAAADAFFDEELTGICEHMAGGGHPAREGTL
jgi:AcrR family transcriptional regulator